MIKKLRDYVEQLFENAPQTPKVKDLKDELTADVIEKYNDLLIRGKTEEESYNQVITGIGDISELIDQLQGPGSRSLPAEDPAERKKSAKLLAVAVMLYIVSVVPLLLSDTVSWLRGEVGLVFMFVIVGTATGLLVYRSASRPSYLKADETLVEEFKEWKSGKAKKNALQEAVFSALWAITLVTYFIISFTYGIWAYSWLIFIIGAAVNKIIKAIFELKEG